MRGLDLAGFVALAAEVSEVEPIKLIELLDTNGVEELLAGAQVPLLPHEAAATLLVGTIALNPLPTGSHRLAVLAAAHLLAVNGLGADLDPDATRELLAGVAAGRVDVASVTAWLDPLVSALDPLEGELRRRLSADAWRAIGLADLRADRHGRREATPADLLMGLFREGTGPAARALGSDGQAMALTGHSARPQVPQRVPAFTGETRKVLELAFRVATEQGHRQIGGGHLLLGVLDGGHAGVLPDGLDAAHVRRRALDLLPPEDESDLAGRLARIASRLRTVDPGAAAELEEVADLQRISLDRIVEIIRAWRGEILLDAVAADPVVHRLLGAGRLDTEPADALQQRLLAKYLADIADQTQLTDDQERELAESICADSTSRRAAEGRRRLVESNLHLVVTIARTYHPSGVPLLQLIQAGNVGLMRAAEHFDPSKGDRFRTSAISWIRRSILEAVSPPPD
jgi:hypothetical protein